MHRMRDGRFVIEDVTRGRWNALERETRLNRVVHADWDRLKRLGVSYKVVIEQEPGSGGKESVEATIRGLAGFTCIADKPTGSKEVRADPFAAQVQGNNVWRVAGPWIPGFIEEAEIHWPHSPHLDQIDAATMAFAHLQANDDLYANFE
jgi:predicted phage terminase large subunit-like protein